MTGRSASICRIQTSRSFRAMRPMRYMGVLLRSDITTNSSGFWRFTTSQSRLSRTWYVSFAFLQARNPFSSGLERRCTRESPGARTAATPRFSPSSATSLPPGNLTFFHRNSLIKQGRPKPEAPEQPLRTVHERGLWRDISGADAAAHRAAQLQ